MLKTKQIFYIILILQLAASNVKAQKETSRAQPEKKVHFSITGYEGTFIAGYVNEGGYLNLTGPNLNISVKKSRWLIGMLPSLRFKKDKSEIKNTFITPSLGVGLTCFYKKIAIQFPLYYNSKTNNHDGKWNLGFGLGLRLN